MQQIDFVRLLTGMTTTGGSVPVPWVARTEQERTALLDADFPMFAPRLLAICRALGGDAAEDAVQDTYLLARKQIGQLRDLDALEPWLTTIAVRQCIRHHRRRRWILDRLSSFLPDDLVVPSTDLELRGLVEDLPPRERTLIVLHYGYGYSLREVADLLGLSHTNVRSIAARTRRRLLQRWKEAYHD